MFLELVEEVKALVKADAEIQKIKSVLSKENLSKINLISRDGTTSTKTLQQKQSEVRKLKHHPNQEDDDKNG